MGKLRHALQEDRAMRNAAKRLVETDWRNITGGLGQRGMGERIADRMEDGALGLAEDARDFAEEHPAKVGGGVVVALAAAIGWMFRDEIAEKLQGWWNWDEL